MAVLKLHIQEIENRYGGTFAGGAKGGWAGDMGEIWTGRGLFVALAHIVVERLIAAPDCGLGLLGRELAIAKLQYWAVATCCLA